MASGGLACLTAWRHTAVFLMEVLPETKEVHHGSKLKWFVAYPLGIKNLSSSNLPFWCSFLMTNKSFAKARKNDSDVSKNSSPESRVRWTFVCHWCDEDSWQRKLWSWAFESSSCLNFSWLDKHKTWCGDCQLQPISERINDLHPKNTTNKNSKYTLFGCFHVSSLQVTKNLVKKTPWILPTHKNRSVKTTSLGPQIKSPNAGENEMMQLSPVDTN